MSFARICRPKTSVKGPQNPGKMSICQRTPLGGGKRGGRKTSRTTPLPKGVLDPPLYVTFSTPPSGFSALLFLYKNPRQSGPEALLEGSKSFREGTFSGTFSSPHTFCTPPYHGPNLGARIHDPKAQTSTTPRHLQKLRSEKLWAEFLFPIRINLITVMRICPFLYSAGGMPHAMQSFRSKNAPQEAKAIYST